MYPVYTYTGIVKKIIAWIHNLKGLENTDLNHLPISKSLMVFLLHLFPLTFFMLPHSSSSPLFLSMFIFPRILHYLDTTLPTPCTRITLKSLSPTQIPPELQT